MAKEKVVYATIENMKALYPKYGNMLLAWSPYTGEEYSACPGDYFLASAGMKLKDASGHVMRLVTKATVHTSVTLPGKSKSSRKRRKSRARKEG